MRKLRTIQVLTAFVAVLAVVVAGQSLASADHKTILWHGNDEAWVKADHSTLVVCDRERDGHYVYAQVRSGYLKGEERDGGDAGCDTQKFPYNWEEMRLCEENKGCTKWWPI